MEAKAPPSKVLFIRDIAPSMTEKAFEDLFSNLPGYVSIRRKPFFAFVEFKDRGFAISAMRRYSGYRHHPLDRPLSIDFDKDPRSRDDYPGQPDDRIIQTSQYENYSSSSSSISTSQPTRKRDYEDDSRYGGEDEGDDEDRSDKHRKSSSSIVPIDDKDDRTKRSRNDGPAPYDKPRYRDEPDMHYNAYQRPRDYDPIQSYPDMPHHHLYFPPPGRLPPLPAGPCSTLFVSNLPKDVTERELSILFRFTRGFINVRLVVREGKYPICFCDYRDMQSAAIAMETLQGFRMDPNDVSSSISIEFDKSRTKAR